MVCPYRLQSALFNLATPLILLTGNLDVEVRSILEEFELREAEVEVPRGKIPVRVDGIEYISEEALVRKIAETKWAVGWSRGLCRLIYPEGTPEFEECVERLKIEAAKRFLGLKSGEIELGCCEEVELESPDKRKVMLAGYISGLAHAFGVPPEKLLESEPVKEYARALGLEDFLEELKRNPELRKKYLW
jgi:hypothetical protein